MNFLDISRWGSWQNWLSSRFLRWCPMVLCGQISFHFGYSIVSRVSISAYLSFWQWIFGSQHWTMSRAWVASEKLGALGIDMIIPTIHYTGHQIKMGIICTNMYISLSICVPYTAPSYIIILNTSAPQITRAEFISVCIKYIYRFYNFWTLRFHE